MERSRQEYEDNPLFELYYAVHRRLFHDDVRAKQFAAEMLEAFNALGSQQITTICKNVPDGIGDYVSQLYFALKLQKTFSKCPQVDLKNISAITRDKLRVAGFIREGKLNDDEIYLFEQGNRRIIEGDELAKKRYLIIKDNLAPIVLKHSPAMMQYLQQSDFVFNLALAITVTNMDFPYFDYLSPQVYLHSWREYGYSFSQYEKFSRIAFCETAMGVKSHEQGIRILPEVKHQAKTMFSLERKAELLQGLENKALLAVMLSDGYKVQDAEKFLAENSIVFGYIQEIKPARWFVRMAAHTAKKPGDLNAIVNTSHFSNIQDDKDFIDHIKQLGYTSIEMVDKAGKKTVLPLLSTAK